MESEKQDRDRLREGLFTFVIFLIEREQRIIKNVQKRSKISIGLSVAIAVFAVARLYFPVIGPRSARELVRTYSQLPVPLFAMPERSKDECGGLFCRDYYAQGLLRLSRNDCTRIILAAKKAGYRDLPLPSQIKPIQDFDAPTVPIHGVYQYIEGPREIRFNWIDKDSCRMFVEFSVQ